MEITKLGNQNWEITKRELPMKVIPRREIPKLEVHRMEIPRMEIPKFTARFLNISKNGSSKNDKHAPVENLKIILNS